MHAADNDENAGETPLLAKLTQDQENASIGWNTSIGSLQPTGVVTFTELDGYTEIHVVMQWYDPPAGILGEWFSKAFLNPEDMLQEDLERFKELVESRARLPTQ